MYIYQEMKRGGYNCFLGDKGKRIQNQLKLIKLIFESINDISFKIFETDLISQLHDFDAIVTSGDKKVIFPKAVNDQFNFIRSSSIPHLIRDVTYLREIPEKTGEDVNNFPRFTWNRIVPSNDNFPYDETYDRWSDLSKKYNLSVHDYKTKGEKILFLLQIPNDASINEMIFSGDNYLDFVIRTLKKIIKLTDRQIILRGHPLYKIKKITLIPFLLEYFKNTNRLIASINNNLKDDLDQSICAVSYNSSASVEAIIYGINVINLSPYQPCFSAASHNIKDIENLKNLEREDALKKLSYLHWSNQELESYENKKYLCSLIIKSMKNNQ